MILPRILSFLSAAATTPVLTPRAPCDDPTVFGITNFRSWTGVADIATLSMDVSDGINTGCTRVSIPSSAGRNTVIPCTNPNIDYQWNGTNLMLNEHYQDCSGQSKIASGNSTVNLYCYSHTIANLGPGTMCESPTPVTVYVSAATYLSVSS